MAPGDPVDEAGFSRPWDEFDGKSTENSTAPDISRHDRSGNFSPALKRMAR
jgi:hypothetical protein